MWCGGWSNRRQKHNNTTMDIGQCGMHCNNGCKTDVAIVHLRHNILYTSAIVHLRHNILYTSAIVHLRRNILYISAIVHLRHNILYTHLNVNKRLFHETQMPCRPAQWHKTLSTLLLSQCTSKMKQKKILSLSVSTSPRLSAVYHFTGGDSGDTVSGSVEHLGSCEENGIWIKPS